MDKFTSVQQHFSHLRCPNLNTDDSEPCHPAFRGLQEEVFELEYSTIEKLWFRILLVVMVLMLLGGIIFGALSGLALYIYLIGQYETDILLLLLFTLLGATVTVLIDQSSLTPKPEKSCSDKKLFTRIYNISFDCERTETV